MNDITNGRATTIGGASQRTGIKIETIRYYEKSGIIPRPERTRGGNRVYSEELIRRLFFIRRSRELGFGLTEISELLGMVSGSDFTCGEIHAVTVRHCEKIRKKIEDLERLHSILSSMAAECSKGDIPDCPIIDRMFAS